MSVDGHTTQMKKEDLDADSLNKMDPFFGGLPSYTIGSWYHNLSVEEIITESKIPKYSCRTYVFRFLCF